MQFWRRSVPDQSPRKRELSGRERYDLLAIEISFTTDLTPAVSRASCTMRSRMVAELTVPEIVTTPFFV
jgi:hypothetical protein